MCIRDRIVAHPDDEVLGFGGVMAMHTALGDSVHVLILATGLSSRNPETSICANDLKQLRGHAREANLVLGVEDIRFGDYPDNKMDTVPLLNIINTIETFIREVNPSTIYTHNAGDLNIDHYIVAKAVLTACRPKPGSNVLEILAGEVNSSTEWAPASQQLMPNEFVDITKFLQCKLRALECYKGELCKWPHPRSIKAVKVLAKWRGAQVGVEAAEAFSLIRRIRL